MKKIILDYILLVFVWFVASLILSGAIRFIGYLDDRDWTYRGILWLVYCPALVVFLVSLTVYYILIYRCHQIYKRYISMGTSRKVALRDVCEEVRIRLPRSWLMVLFRVPR